MNIFLLDTITFICGLSILCQIWERRISAWRHAWWSRRETYRILYGCRCTRGRLYILLNIYYLYYTIPILSMVKSEFLSLFPILWISLQSWKREILVLVYLFWVCGLEWCNSNKQIALCHRFICVQIVNI